MRFRLAVAIAVFLLSVVGDTHAQESDRVFSGPQVAEKLPALKVRLAYGKEADQTVDLIERAAGKPTLLVIVNGSNRPAARLTRVLMSFAEMHQKTLFSGVVYLADDPTAAMQQLKRAVSWWKVGAPVGVSIDGVEGPGSYGLNRDVNLTILVCDKGRVTNNFALVQPSETDAARILKEVVSLVGGRVPTAEEVMFLSAPIHKLANASWRTAPADVRLRRLICTALAAEDDKSARSVATAVEKYVGDDESRHAALGNAAALLLEGRTRVRGKPIVKYLRSWRMKYDTRSEK